MPMSATEQPESSEARMTDEELLRELTTNESFAGHTRRRKRKAASRATIPLLVALLAVGAVIAVGSDVGHDAYVRNTARAEYHTNRNAYDKVVKEFELTRDLAGQLLTNCGASVNDAELCTQLDQSLTAASEVDTQDPGKIDIYDSPTSLIQSRATRLGEILAGMNAAMSDLEKKIDAIRSATQSKTHEDFDAAVAGVEAAISEAKSLAESYTNELSDEDIHLVSEVTELATQSEEKLGEIRASVDDSTRDYTVLTSQAVALETTLRAKIEEITKAHDAWQQNERIEEARASASASASAAAAQELERLKAEASASAAANAGGGAQSGPDATGTDTGAGGASADNR